MKSSWRLTLLAVCPVVLLAIVSLACNAAVATPTTAPKAPGDTPIIMCTPPLCKTGEVFYCPTSCPGGCGTQCATKTPTATVSGKVAPGVLTPIIMCTPPLCKSGEVFYCSTSCPGGCGTQCATRTPVP